MTTFPCPHCSQPIRASRATPELSILSDHFSAMRDYEATAWSKTGPPPDRPQFTETERREPVRAPALEPDVYVPAVKAVFSGVACAFLTGLASIWQRWPWYWTAASLIGGAGLGWFWFVSGSDKLLWRVEKVINRDIDQNGVIGEPEPIPQPQPQRLRVEIRERQHTAFLDVPHDKAVDFAKSVLNGGSMSESGWKRHFGGIKEYREFRDKLVQAKLITWKNENAKAQGLRLTRRGRQVLAKLSNLSPTDVNIA